MLEGDYYDGRRTGELVVVMVHALVIYSMKS